MTEADLRTEFARLAGADFPRTATLSGGGSVTGTFGTLKSEVSMSMYGISDAYKVSLYTVWTASAPEKFSSLTIDNVRYVVIGVEDFQHVSRRIDLREEC